MVLASQLVDAVWGEEPPAATANALQSLASRLRRLLPDLIESHPAGYRLALDPEAVDAVRFENLALAGREELRRDPRRAASTLREALALWRGPPLADAAEADFAAAARARLEELHLGALEDRVEADLAIGGDDRLVAEIEELVTAHPLRERVCGQLMRALSRAGRQADALAAYERLRARLAEELGVDPSKELQAVHVAVLRGENASPPMVAASPADRDRGRDRRERAPAEAAALAPPVPAWTNLRAQITSFVGRTEDIARVTTVLAGARELGLLARQGRGPGPVPPQERIVQAIDALLARCPKLRVLATSREPLGLTGEVLHPVGPLPMPEGEVTPAEATVRPVLRICRALDGLPLAIELAAARLRALSPGQIAARLDDRFRLLADGGRPATARHQTLRAVVDWSWDLLGEPERVLLRRLSVFAGGATLEAVERVRAGPDLGGLAGDEVLYLLAALVDKSLVVAGEDRDAGEVRYAMLETVRAYGEERRWDAGEDGALRRAHAGYFLELAEQAEPQLRRRDQ